MILLIGLVFVVAFIAYYKWTFAYWKNKNLVCFEQPTIPFGNMKAFVNKNSVVGTFFKNVYDKMKSKGYKHAGGFIGPIPMYFVNDLDIMKTILQRRFDHFSDRLYFVDETDHPAEANLVFVGGERWKYLRTKLSPAFTPVRIKGMLDIVVQCAFQMEKSIDSRKSESIDINKTAVCYFTDIIGACGFGLDCNSSINLNSEFIEYGKKFLNPESIIRRLKVALKSWFPQMSRLLRLQSFDTESFQFFVDLFKDTAKYRKHNNVVRKDLLQLLLEAEPDLNVEEIDNESSKSAAIIKEIASHALVFLVGGFETSSITTTFSLFELASNLDVQEKLINEIDRVLIKYEGKITYEAIMDMKYMHQVVDEVLRKYPPLPYLTRRCVKDCEIPDTGLTIEEGVVTIISILGIHHDPEYYPDPEIFNPERFSEENKRKRTPYTYLPFGEGPRNCPAYRFGLVQIKVGLIVLLQKYTISLNKKTQLPIQLDGKNFLLMPKTQILLDFADRKGNK